MNSVPWMIYGAYGYTGRLIAAEARRRGMNPILAGRSPQKTAAIAQELSLEHRAFDLENESELAANLQGMRLLLHCAGPFSTTAAPMVAACLKRGAHYLDITGEIDVFEHIAGLHESARAAGVALCPGVGFDVIPTDCLAASLKVAMPDATYLALGFSSRSKFSPGTAKTSVEGLAKGGRIRRNGQLVRVPLAYRVRQIDFGDGDRNAMTIPWGDVSTAYRTTAIPNIEVYIPTSRRMVRRLKWLNLVRGILGWSPIQGYMKGRIDQQIDGPSEEDRHKHRTQVWGEVLNAAGQKKTARLETANGYDVTVTGSLAVVTHLLEEKVEGGSYTPSQLMGADFVTSLLGSSPIVVS